MSDTRIVDEPDGFGGVDRYAKATVANPNRQTLSSAEVRTLLFDASGAFIDYEVSYLGEIVGRGSVGVSHWLFGDDAGAATTIVSTETSPPGS